MTHTLIFDVNETLLDMQPVRENINNAFEKDVAELWFTKLLHYSLVETSAGNYMDFSAIAAAVTKMLARTEGVKLNEEDIEKILEPVSSLEPHKDVMPGLEKLKSAGFKLVALSNGKPEVLSSQLSNSGLEDYFEGAFSIEETKRYKPHREAYDFVLKKINVKPSSVMMVAAHGWDVFGAQNAGLNTCFIQRKGKHLYELASPPDLHFDGILELAEFLEPKIQS